MAAGPFIILITIVQSLTRKARILLIQDVTASRS